MKFKDNLTGHVIEFNWLDPKPPTQDDMMEVSNAYYQKHGIDPNNPETFKQETPPLEPTTPKPDVTPTMEPITAKFEPAVAEGTIPLETPPTLGKAIPKPKTLEEAAKVPPPELKEIPEATPENVLGLKIPRPLTEKESQLLEETAKAKDPARSEERKNKLQEEVALNTMFLAFGGPAEAIGQKVLTSVLKKVIEKGGAEAAKKYFAEPVVAKAGEEVVAGLQPTRLGKIITSIASWQAGTIPVDVAVAAKKYNEEMPQAKTDEEKAKVVKDIVKDFGYDRAYALLLSLPFGIFGKIKPFEIARGVPEPLKEYRPTEKIEPPKPETAPAKPKGPELPPEPGAKDFELPPDLKPVETVEQIKSKPRPKAPDEIVKPLEHLDKQIAVEKDPRVKELLQDNRDLSSDSAIFTEPGKQVIRSTSLFEKSMRKLDEAKIPYAYARVDLSNVGGLNELSKTHAVADEHMRRVNGDTLVNDVNAAGGLILREGGADELRIVLPGFSKVDAEELIEGARQKGLEIAKQRGLDKKHK